MSVLREGRSVVRIWTTEIDPTRADEYDEFARTRSLPMFAAQPGFLGVVLAAVDERRTVITLWRDSAAAAALDTSESYQATVAAIGATGFLVGDARLDVLEVSHASLPR
jgi:heme-degrading monooxygenase HmoA